jgi:hypothetical protein
LLSLIVVAEVVVVVVVVVVVAGFLIGHCSFESTGK